MEILTICALLLSVICVVACLSVREQLRELQELQERNREHIAFAQKQINDRLTALETGAVPDHEKAKAAVKATNEFMDGVANIMGFDPYAALRKSREQEGGFGE